MNGKKYLFDVSEFSFPFFCYLLYTGSSNFHQTHINIFFTNIWSEHVEPRRSTDENFHENCRVLTENMFENRERLDSKRQGEIYA